MASSFGLKPRVIPKGNERVLVTLGDEPDGSAATTATSIRAAAWDELLSSEAHRSPPPVSGLYLDADLVDEHGPRFLSERDPSNVS
jgi:hypothetical protein